MDGGHLRQIVDLPPGLPKPVLPVRLVRVDKVLFVDQADPFDGRPPHDDAGRTDPVYRAHRGPDAMVAGVVWVQALADVRDDQKLLEQCGKVEETGLVGTVGVKQVAAHSAGLRVFVQKANHRLYGFPIDHRVVVENVNIASAAVANALVVTAGYADVSLILDDLDIGKPFGQHPLTTIRRAIVGHHDLVGKGQFCRLDRFQTLLKIVPVVPVNQSD